MLVKVLLAVGKRMKIIAIEVWLLLATFVYAEACCNLPCDCVWGNWGAWAACSKTCGGGMQTSKRIVATLPYRGGSPCRGESERKQYCNPKPCPGRMLQSKGATIASVA